MSYYKPREHFSGIAMQKILAYFNRIEFNFKDDSSEVTPQDIFNKFEINIETPIIRIMEIWNKDYFDSSKGGKNSNKFENQYPFDETERLDYCYYVQKLKDIGLSHVITLDDIEYNIRDTSISPYDINLEYMEKFDKLQQEKTKNNFKNNKFVKNVKHSNFKSTTVSKDSEVKISEVKISESFNVESKVESAKVSESVKVSESKVECAKVESNSSVSEANTNENTINTCLAFKPLYTLGHVIHTMYSNELNNSTQHFNACVHTTCDQIIKTANNFNVDHYMLNVKMIHDVAKLFNIGDEKINEVVSNLIINFKNSSN
jgi:hypothetical protein